MLNAEALGKLLNRATTNMRKYRYLLFFIPLISYSTDYKTVFTFDYSRAEQFVIEHKNIIDSVCEQYKHEPLFVCALFFPELLRFSMMQNYFETKALEKIYISKGSAHADFSIGRIQMTPSFAELIEYEIANSARLYQKYGNLIIDSTDSVLIRTKRINRLNSFHWQLKYINCFIDIVSSKFHGVSSLDNKNKIKFYATAYNHCFNCSKDEILRWQNIKLFPYGLKSDAVQYSYAEVAYYFYNNHTKP